MGGVAKGLLVTDSGETIVARTARIFSHVNATPVLLGNASAYGGVGIAAMADEPGVEGPLAGLLALLRHAATARVFLVGGDMPFVTEALAVRLATMLDSHDAVSAHDGERYLPLFSGFARVRVNARVVDAGVRSPTGLLQALDAARMSLSREELALLRDWDTEEDRLAT